MLEDLTEKVHDVNGTMKIREYLKKRLNFSTSLIAKVKYDNVILNGTPVHMRATVKNGDTIKVVFPEEDSENIEPIPYPLNIAYEDDYILVVNKPINMPCHPARGNHLITLANAVRAYFGKPFVFRAVNRLDRDTSGIVIIAKDVFSAKKLCQSMKEKHFVKKYLAIVEGVPNPKEGIIDAPIERIEEGNIKRWVMEGGKPCQTKYRVIDVLENGNSVVEVLPLTGRTHQIRVHFAYIGHPLVDDFLYGTRTDGKTYRLHCESITFPHPKTDELITVKADFDINQGAKNENS